MNAIGYLCEIPDAPPALSIDAQRAAVLEACARLGLEARVRFPDRAGDERTSLLQLLGAARATTGVMPPPVVIADIAVLGDGVREQWLRVLQCVATRVELALADGRVPDDALTAAWAERGAADRRRERALEGMRRRALRGEPLGRPPYGYRIERGAGADARSRLVPDDREAPVVRRIFAMYVTENEGVRRVAARLNADGVRTRRGGAWNMASIRDLLRNPVYTGLYRRLGITIVGAHPALASADEFRAAQRRMSARRSPGAGHRRQRVYALSGIARCGYCGARLVGASRHAAGGGEHHYYRCGAAAAQGRCRTHTRHAEELEAEVLAQLADGAVRTPLLDGPAVRRTRAARSQTLRRELDRMIDRRAAGQWSAAQLERLGAPVALELLLIEESAARTQAAVRTGLPGALRTARRRLLAEWARLDEQARQQRLAEVVREIVVTDDEVRIALES